MVHLTIISLCMIFFHILPELMISSGRFARKKWSTLKDEENNMLRMVPLLSRLLFLSLVVLLPPLNVNREGCLCCDASEESWH